MNRYTQPNDSSTDGASDAGVGTGLRPPAADGMRAATWAAWIALAATFAVFAAASFNPDQRLWGINHLAFYGPAVRWGTLAVTALFFVPPIAAAVWRGLLWLLHPFFRGLESGVNALALSGVISFIIFASFRSATKLLGDGYFITNTFRSAAENGLGIFQYLKTVTVNEHVYPATEFVNYAASWIAGRLGASPAGGVWILSCLLGALIVVGLFANVRRTAWPDGTKLAVLALALFTGAIELFFGYIEHYTPSMALGALYVLTVLRAVGDDRGGVSTPGLVLIAALLFHVQALLLVPSFLWLVLWVIGFRRAGRRAPLASVLVCAAVVLLAAIALVVAATAGERASGLPAVFRRLLLSPPGSDGTYGILSGAHLLDAANVLLLLCPAVLMFVTFAVSRRLSRAGVDETTDDARETDEAAGGGAGAGDQKTTASLAWSLAVPAVLFILLFKPQLGMARDWDLYCLAYLGIAVAGVYALVWYTTRAPSSRQPALLAPAVVLCAAMVIPWVGVNASATRSEARYRAILQYDRTNPGYAYENLVRYYEDNLQYTRQIETLKTAFEMSGNPRFLKKLADAYNETGRPADAKSVLHDYLAKRPVDDEARKFLINILARQKAVDEMIAVCLEGTEYSPKMPDYHFFLGNAYLAKGMNEEGLRAFENCRKLNPPAAMVREMNRMAEQIGSRAPDGE